MGSGRHYADQAARHARENVRRDVVKYGAATAISVATIPASQLLAADATTVSGFVYENRSGARRRQVSDPAISGVLVSNGRDVVKTDADGHYTLPIDDESVIFVIKPTGYASPVNEEMLPRFYYIHQPVGSPQSLNLPLSRHRSDRSAAGLR
jgi:hypothetical protein